MPLAAKKPRTTTFRQPEAGWVRPPLEGVAGTLATMVIDTIKQTAARAPRSLQASIGPSEIGTPCTRRLGYRILDWDPKPNSDTDPWPATVGTAVHAWLADTFTAWNARLGAERFLIERRVTLPGRRRSASRAGSCRWPDPRSLGPGSAARESGWSFLVPCERMEIKFGWQEGQVPGDRLKRTGSRHEDRIFPPACARGGPSGGGGGRRRRACRGRTSSRRP